MDITKDEAIKKAKLLEFDTVFIEDMGYEKIDLRYEFPSLSVVYIDNDDNNYSTEEMSDMLEECKRFQSQIGYRKKEILIARW